MGSGTRKWNDLALEFFESTVVTNVHGVVSKSKHFGNLDAAQVVPVDESKHLLLGLGQTSQRRPDGLTIKNVATYFCEVANGIDTNVVN